MPDLCLAEFVSGPSGKYMERDAISNVGKALQQVAHYLNRTTLGLEFDPDGDYWSILQWIPVIYFQPCSLELKQKQKQKQKLSIQFSLS